MKRTFREIYCDHHHLDPKRYQHSVLGRCLYAHAKPIWWVMGWAHPAFFQPDLEFIESMAQLRTRRDFSNEVADFQTHPGNRNFLKRVLRLRVSVRRLRELVDAELDGENTRTPSGSNPSFPTTPGAS